jgi:hypothetical protein
MIRHGGATREPTRPPTLLLVSLGVAVGVLCYVWRELDRLRHQLLTLDDMVDEVIQLADHTDPDRSGLT